MYSTAVVNTELSQNFNGEAQQEVAAATDLISKTPSWRQFLVVHPAADRIPEASEDEKRALAADLVRQGQRQPVILVHVATRPNAAPQLLDGRTRLDLLSATGIDVVDAANGKILVQHRVVQVANDAEAEQLSLSLNVHRRHLTAEQKRELIVQLLTATPEKSNRQIAETVKVDHKTVASVRAEKESTGEIPQLTKTVGADGKARKQPTKRKVYPKKKEPTPPTAPTGPAEAEASTTREIARLNAIVADLHKQAATNKAKIIVLESNLANIASASTNEIMRKDAEIEELRNAKRQLEIKVADLESEIEEAKAAWNSGASELSALRLADFLQHRLERDGVDAFDLFQKLRARIDRKPAKIIDLKAAPAAEEA